MERIGEVSAIEGCGLAGDRYCVGTGHWSRFGRVCQVTLMAAEDLAAIEKETGVRVRDGEHRRNVVTRGDRKSTRLNSSHANISYAVFCLKKKKKHVLSYTGLNFIRYHVVYRTKLHATLPYDYQKQCN